jgi:hypothetical protein
VPPPELQFTPAAQVEFPPPEQETLQVVPLQLTVSAHEFRPEHWTVLLAAVVLMPPAQDLVPLQVMSHRFPAQLTGSAQLSVPAQVIWVLAATLVTGP